MIRAIASASVVALVALVACSSSSDPAPSSSSGSSSGGTSDAAADSASDAGDGGELICSPGTNVFCRCPDNSEGTKPCIDGKSFGACQPCN